MVLLSPRVLLTVIVLSNGSVDKYSIEFDTDLVEEDVDGVRDLVAVALDNRPPSDVGPVPKNGTAQHRLIAEDVLSAIIASNDPDRVYVDGASNVAGAFEAVDSVKRVLTILEQQLVVVNVLTDVLDRGLNVAIGTETGLDRLEDCSVVVAPYEIEGEQAGSIAVLGPTRMHYPQAMAAVAAVSHQLGQRLSEG